MKLCSLCHWLLEKHRWLLPFAGLLISLLLRLILPRWLGMALISLCLTVIALLLIYTRDAALLRTRQHVRLPSPADARAEIVMVDAPLVDLGVQVQAVAQPLNPCPEMSMRMGSGALLLGTAMVFLAQEASPTEERALLSAVTTMNLRPQMLLNRSPLIERGTEEGMRRVTVQDGTQERSYFMADAETVAAACASIWENRVRLMGQHDRERIIDAAKYMAAGGCRVLAFATAADDERPVFLGMAALGDGLDQARVQELQELRSMGLTLILRDEGTAPLDIAALRRMLDIPDLHARPDVCLSCGSVYPDTHCLTIMVDSGSSLSAPIRQLRDHFARMSRMLSRLGCLMALAFGCSCIAGSAWALPCTMAILASAYIGFGDLLHCRRITWPCASIALSGSLLARLLLNAAVPDAANAAGTLLCIALSIFLSLILAPRGEHPSLRSLLPLGASAGVSVLSLVLLSLSVLPASLLPMAFTMVLGCLIGLCAWLTCR